jgi:ABC-type uncharacterized transport system fused permease/ATPase subunit
MVSIGHRFVTVSENKNQSEAELRYVLTRLSPATATAAVTATRTNQVRRVKSLGRPP